MDPKELDRQCRDRKIRAVYLMPTVHNRLGAVMDEVTRLRIIETAQKHDLLIIEGAAYALLEPNRPPSLFSLAPERTVYVGGFSKSIATGLRLGYVVAPAAHIDRLLEVIRATTWNPPALISGLITGCVEDGTLTKSEGARIQDGAERQQVCRAVLGCHIPDGSMGHGTRRCCVERRKGFELKKRSKGSSRCTDTSSPLC